MARASFTKRFTPRLPLFCENRLVTVNTTQVDKIDRRQARNTGKGSTLYRFLYRSSIAILCALPLLGIAASAVAQSKTASEFQPLSERKWEFGPFVSYENGVGTRSDFHFFAAGFQAGRNVTPILHAGPLTGRFELGANVQPLWQAYTPAAHTETVTSGDSTITERVGGGTFTGASVMPVIFRWNLANRSQRFSPWFQAAAGVIYTSHKFPPDIEVPKGTPGGTSVFNFRSGGGGGFHYFTRPRRSVDFGINFEHISSASLGDRNPGVNASVQMQVGYSWWK
jgi:lipid A 3-O-deacylase